MKYFIVVISLFGAVAYAVPVTNVRIRVLDSFSGDVSSVTSKCQTKVGSQYDSTALIRDVNTLKSSGDFEEISAEGIAVEGGMEVIFKIKRKVRYQAPLIVRGNDYFDAGRIAKEAGLKDGYLYGEGDLAAAAMKIRHAYQKHDYYEAKVSYKVEPTKLGDGGNIVFTINEGPCCDFDEFQFPGLNNVEVSEVREAIGDYPWWNPLGWFTDGPITEDQLAQCSPKIEEVLRNHGYLDAKVSNPVRKVDEDDECDVVFSVVEGEQYKVGKTIITGLTRYDEKTVREKSMLPERDEIAGLNNIDEAAHRLQVVVGSGDAGLADTRVDVKRIPSGNGVVDVIFEVTEGVPVVIDDVIIRGNDYTKDKVLRREIALGPGDRMLEDRAERSQRRLENLDYFSRVRYYLEPSGRGVNELGQEYRNLVYEVEEKNTGSFMVGVGASSVNSAYLSAEVSQSNFDLFAPGKLFRGAGQKARLYAQWGPKIGTAEASFTEPHLFGRTLELTIDGYRRKRWYDEYDLYRTGADIVLSYPVKFWPTWGPFGRLGVKLAAEFIEMDQVDEAYYIYDGKRTRYFKDMEDQFDQSWEYSVRLFWNRNSTDNFRIPSRGGKTQIFGDVIQGDNQYWRIGASHRQYFTVWPRFKHVFMIGLRAETMDMFSGDDDVPVYSRMFLGSHQGIRGIKFRNVSPMARREGSNDYAPIGGQTLFCANFEYTIPIINMLRVSVFTDVGSIGVDSFELDFEDTFAWTVGVGVRLDIPMFPIRLDFAKPLKQPEAAEEELFSFSIGYDF